MGRSGGSSAWARACSALSLSLLVLAACGGPAPTPTVTIEGRVVSGAHGPLAGVLVHVTGRPVTSTDADGAFTVDGVSVPYTLTIGTTGSDPWAHVFQGMTSLTPVVATVDDYLPVVQSRLSGFVASGAAVPSHGRVVVCVEGVGFDVIGCDLARAGDTHYDLTVGWFRLSASASVRVHALWITVDAFEVPLDYGAYATFDVTLVAGGNIEVHLSPGPALAKTSVQGSIAAAGGAAGGYALVAVRLGDRLAMPVYRSLTADATLALELPVVGTGDYHASMYAVFATGGGAARWATFAAGDEIAVVAGPPPQLLAPVSGATDVAAHTEFRAEGGPGGARTFHWVPSGSTGGPTVWLTTMAGSARLPDLSPLGLGFVPGGSYRWSVSASDGGLDDAVGSLSGLLYYHALGFGGPGFDGDGTIAGSDDRGFTLAP